MASTGNLMLWIILGSILPKPVGSPGVCPRNLSFPRGRRIDAGARFKLPLSVLKFVPPKRFALPLAFATFLRKRILAPQGRNPPLQKVRKRQWQIGWGSQENTGKRSIRTQGDRAPWDSDRTLWREALRTPLGFLWVPRGFVPGTLVFKEGVESTRGLVLSSR